MRAVCFGLLSFAAVVFGDEQTARRPVTSTEAIVLSEALALGHRIVVTLRHYVEVTHPPMTIQSGRIGESTDLFTRTPPIDVLRAVRYLSESDCRLARRYHAALHPVPSDAPATQPLLTMHTDRGVLVFQVSGEVALEPTK